MCRFFHLLVVVVAIFMAAKGVDAVTCYCFNGRAATSESCDCSCAANYLPPTCTFGISDNVSITFSLNVSTSNFNSELFTNAVAFAASATATFIRAKNISKFNAVVSVVQVPGYAVQRVLDSVAYKDPWVTQFGVVSADVITPSVSSSTADGLFGIDYTVYTQGNITITVSGIVYLACAIILALGLSWMELNFSKNTDEHMMSSPRRPRKANSDRKKGRGDDADDAVQVISSKPRDSRKNNYMTPNPNE